MKKKLDKLAELAKLAELDKLAKLAVLAELARLGSLGRLGRLGLLGLLGWLGWLGWLGLLATLSSCKKDIDIAYHQVKPLYVVEATVSNDGMQARISQTNDMDDNTTTSDISGASVLITGSDGSREILYYTDNGTYTSTAKGTPGVTYTIEIGLDGQHFTSTSIMQKMPTINNFRFFWKKIVGERFLMAELLFQDIPNEDNWYFIHLYRNDIGFRWSVKRDDVDPNKELQQLISFAREGSDDKDMLHEGDQLHLELRAIDQRTYDYFYSMQIMGNTGTNPIQNFTGGCLGYFSAHSQVTYDCTYHAADVEEE